jgi:hypothetical protein
MIKDAHLIFDDVVALTASRASTNVIDMTKKGDAVAGAELYLVVRVGTALDSSEEDAVLQISIESDSAVGFATAKVILAKSDLIAEAALTAKTTIWKIKLPPGLKQFVRLYYAVTVHNFTGGTVEAFLTPDVNIA